MSIIRISAKLTFAFTVLCAGLLLQPGLGLAESVTFEASEYYCEKIGGDPQGDDTCEINAEPDEAACYELERFDMPLSKVRGEFCEQRQLGTGHLLALSQRARTRAMGYVSMGYDERRCDPQYNSSNTRCNQQAYKAYFVYMCAAHLCSE